MAYASNHCRPRDLTKPNCKLVDVLVAARRPTTASACQTCAFTALQRDLSTGSTAVSIEPMTSPLKACHHTVQYGLHGVTGRTIIPPYDPYNPYDNQRVVCQLPCHYITVRSVRSIRIIQSMRSIRQPTCSVPAAWHYTTVRSVSYNPYIRSILPAHRATSTTIPAYRHTITECA